MESCFLRYAGIVYLTLPTLNKWINKKKLKKKTEKNLPFFNEFKYR